MQPGSGGNPIDASLARHDGDIIDFFFRQVRCTALAWALRTTSATAQAQHAGVVPPLLTPPRPLHPPVQYNLGARKQVRGRAARALAALQATEPSVSQLSLERDVLPKLEVRLPLTCP